MNFQELHKPLRNHIRKTGVIDSLWVIHAYVQRIQYGRAIPPGLEVPSSVLSKGVLEKYVYGWSLDVLAPEALINSPDESARIASRTLRQWNYFAGAVNKLKELEDALGGAYPKGSVLLEVHRIAHRQFQWQRPPNARWLARYYKVFSHPVIDEILRLKLGLSAWELYVMALACMGHYAENVVLRYHFQIEIPGLDLRMFDLLCSHFSTDLASIRVQARAAQKLDANYAYVLNPLRAYPMIRTTIDGHDSIIAPIPFFLIRRLTEGIYYEIRDEPGFAEAFEQSFQNYVGEVVARANVREVLQVYGEREYYVGKLRKDTVDWSSKIERVCFSSSVRRSALDLRQRVRSKPQVHLRRS